MGGGRIPGGGAYLISARSSSSECLAICACTSVGLAIVGPELPFDVADLEGMEDKGANEAVTAFYLKISDVAEVYDTYSGHQVVRIRDRRSPHPDVAHDDS